MLRNVKLEVSFSFDDTIKTEENAGKASDFSHRARRITAFYLMKQINIFGGVTLYEKRKFVYK